MADMERFGEMTASLRADILVIGNDALPLIRGVHLIAIIIIKQSS